MSKLIFQNMSQDYDFDCIIKFVPNDSSAPLPRVERLNRNSTWPIDLEYEVDSISVVDDSDFKWLSSVRFEDRYITTFAFAKWPAIMDESVKKPDLMVIAIEILDAE
ncbi:MAG: hypothetical protein IT281_02225 [Ignavibacteria bacterium]|nr:hypothetical protein [Ignavibacteria bacterium]MCC7158335.1 hypothetical protein [Ignavibacteria bacterium]